MFRKNDVTKVTLDAAAAVVRRLLLHRANNISDQEIDSSRARQHYIEPELDKSKAETKATLAEKNPIKKNIARSNCLVSRVGRDFFAKKNLHTAIFISKTASFN